MELVHHAQASAQENARHEILGKYGSNVEVPRKARMLKLLGILQY
jgi:hypothetical protein